MVRSNVVNRGVLPQLVEWNRNWLMMGGFVACSTCLEIQSIDYMGEPFKHAGNCKRINEPEESPWVALEAILNWSSDQGRGAINPGP
jgi:hypothetical protein